MPDHPRSPGRAPDARTRRTNLAASIAVVLIVAVTAAIWLFNNRGDATDSGAANSVATSVAANNSPSATSAATRPAATTPAATKPGTTRQRTQATMPARVATTLALIDAGRWPAAANSPGTQGGRSFRNNEGLLPRADSAGRRMRYQEWDVNAKASDRGRDAERIITAADGSAWYTLDHYRTFIKIRGPDS